MNIQNKYGTLLTPDAKLYRKYFSEMVKLVGIQVLYYPIRYTNQKWSTYAEYLNDVNTKPLLIGCILNEHLDQKTLKKLGWISELQPNSLIIHVSYDTPNIQQGCLFVLPSGLDDGKGRLFRCVNLATSMIYPSSIACEIVPEYEDTFQLSNNNFEHSSFNLLNIEEGYE